jgi:Dyp-type peroxidase family
MTLELNDIQRLVVSSSVRLTCAAYVLFHVKDAAYARAWTGRRAVEITTAAEEKPERSINLAFTSPGLKNLGLKQDVCATFSFPFQEGMATDHRARILGDQDENAADKWDWGGKDSTVDVLLVIFAKDETALETELGRQLQDAGSEGALDLVKVLRAGRQPDTHEHFGFNDGIGQPVIAGTRNEERQKARTNHVTALPAGEFLLGHENVYGVPADSPVVEVEDDPNEFLPTVPPDAIGLNATLGMRDLGRNGSYLVFRQLEQQVAKFWDFLDKTTQGPGGISNAVARERLAAKLVGRWKSGAPLVLAPDLDDAQLSNENNFTYLENDSSGFRCPIGSHIRRANPRDSLGSDAPTALTSANRHRIMRRGRSYGPRLQDPLVDDKRERGLHFICLNSDIERQFEFVQQTWINNPVFGGLYAEVDPLIGNLPKGDALFTVQASPLRSVVHDLSRFVTVKGGAYFFLPSVRALHYLASL